MLQLLWSATPLIANEPSIRLLKLRRAEGHMPILCDLQVVSLDDRHTYDALSYVWGEPQPNVHIKIDGHKCEIRPNLKHFLECLMLPNEDRLVWVDAVCIDQSSTVETNHQLALMTRIYREARATHIWFGHLTSTWQDEIPGPQYIPTPRLSVTDWDRINSQYQPFARTYIKAGGKGPLSATTLDLTNKQTPRVTILNQGLKTLDKLREGTHFHELPIFLPQSWASEESRLATLKLNPQWALIMECIRWLVSRPWWFRVWTLQEAVLPRREPIVHVGTHQIELTRILAGFSSMIEHSITCCKQLKEVALTYYQLYAFRLYWPAHCLQRHRAGYVRTQSPFSISNAINATLNRKASDLRDYFFGVMGLLPRQLQIDFKHNAYCTNIAGVYSQCSKLLYNSSFEGFGYLAEAKGARDSVVPDLPSWTLDLSNRGQADKRLTVRYRCFKASADHYYKDMCSLRKRKGECSTVFEYLPSAVLTVRGIKVGTVDMIPKLNPSPADEESVSRVVTENRRLFRKIRPNASDNCFWRAMFMDRDVSQHWKHLRKPLSPNRLDEAKRWFEHFRRAGDPCDLLVNPRFPSRARGRFHYEELAVNVKRCQFFLTTSGMPGLGAPEITLGDELFVLAGCPIPMVLRPVIRYRKAGFTVVGGCFVDGCMYGEALPVAEMENEWQLIDLH